MVRNHADVRKGIYRAGVVRSNHLLSQYLLQLPLLSPTQKAQSARSDSSIMSDFQNDNFFSAFEPYGPEYTKQQGLDFVSFHSPSDILAPHPDLFELELDSSLAAFDAVQLQLLTVDSKDAYSFLRSDTPTCGPPSTFTVSSESAYETLSSHSESFYNLVDSPCPQTTFPLDLEMDFQRVRVTNSGCSDYSVSAQATNPSLPVTVDPSAFSALPLSPRSPPAPVDHNYKRTSFSDYGGSTRITSVPKSSSADFYGLGYMQTDNPVTPTTMSQLPTVNPTPQPRSVRGLESQSKEDPRKKYQCPTCPRG